MSKRPYYAASGVVVVLVCLLLSLPSSTATRAKLALSSLFLPLFGLMGSAHSLAGQVNQALLPRRVLWQRLALAQQQENALALRAAQGEEALRENARLRQLLAWQAQTTWHFRAARVIGRDTATWWRTVRIDLGRRDGLRPDLPVLIPEGLVGRVTQVAYTSAVVVLVGDPQCRVAVRVRETGENGVLASTSAGALDPRLVDLTYLPRNTALRPGQTVYTSGLGGVFPAGIPVGAIVDSRSIGYGLATEARVKLSVDSSRLEEVMVLFP